MKNFLKKLGLTLLKLGKTAAINAINNPKTTISGIGAVTAGVGAIAGGPITAGNIGGALVGIIGGIGLVLADDPAKKSENVKDE